MEPPRTPDPMVERDSEITATVVRERARLGNFIRQRVRDPGDAEDILQDVFFEFVEAYRLPAPIEQASAWLFHVARNRIIDRFRKKKELPIADMAGSSDSVDDADSEYRLDLALPSQEAGPEAVYSRSVLLKSLQNALDELPPEQREVFVAHELDGQSFKELAAASGVGVNTLLARKRYAVIYLRSRLRAAYEDLED